MSRKHPKRDMLLPQSKRHSRVSYFNDEEEKKVPLPTITTQTVTENKSVMIENLQNKKFPYL
jgi:hypothetical protein